MRLWRCVELVSFFKLTRKLVMSMKQQAVHVKI